MRSKLVVLVVIIILIALAFFYIKIGDTMVHQQKNDVEAASVENKAAREAVEQLNKSNDETQNVLDGLQ